MQAAAQSTTTTSQTNAFDEEEGRDFLFPFSAGTWDGGRADFSTGLRGAAAGGGGEDARGDVAVLALRRWRAGVLDMTDYQARKI